MKGMRKIMCLALALAMLFSGSVLAQAGETFKIYSPSGETAVVPANVVDAYLKTGWYEVPVQTIYAPDGRYAVVGVEAVESFVKEGWYTEPVTILYSLTEDAIVVAEKDLNKYNSSEWYRVPVAKMYAPGDKTIVVNKNDVEAYKAVGWYEVPVAQMYAPGDKTIAVSKNDVEAYKAVGWYTFPVVTMYTFDGREMIIDKNEVEAYKAVGWYVSPFPDVLGQYVSYYNAALYDRSTNVELAAKSINGKVLMPGEVFSYNATVGPRTAERGFKVATIFVGGETAQGLGGGICQTSSTLYSAVLHADLDIVERTNHSLKVTYVPNGMDATVSWGSLDFKFKNSTKYPIRIQCEYGGGTLKVSVMGTKEDKSKSIEVISEGSGSIYNTYKIYYENGVEVNRKFIARSVYGN